MLLPEPLTKGQCPHVNSHDFHIPFENVFLIRKHLIFSPFNRVRKKTVNFPPLAQRPHRCEEPAQRRPHLLNCSRPHRSASQVTEVWMRTARAFCSQRSLTQTPRSLREGWSPCSHQVSGPAARTPRLHLRTAARSPLVRTHSLPPSCNVSFLGPIMSASGPPTATQALPCHL